MGAYIDKVGKGPDKVGRAGKGRGRPDGAAAESTKSTKSTESNSRANRASRVDRVDRVNSLVDRVELEYLEFHKNLYLKIYKSKI